MSKKEKVRYTTYLDPRDLELLNDLSEETGRPVSSLICEAVEDFFEEIDEKSVENRHVPPVAKSWYRRKFSQVKRKKETEGGNEDEG